MHLSLLFLLTAVLSFTSADTTTTSAAATASVTLVDFGALPSCATLCGPLYDAQGSCTPPGSPVTNLTTYEKCFCQYSTLQSFYTESNGVCPNACSADTNGAAELVEIQSWFTSYCASATASASASAATTSESSSSGSTSEQTAGQTWFHNHWRWVVMLIVLVIGISTVWIAAACLRRRYLQKREREIEMRVPASSSAISWGPHQLQAMSGGYSYTDSVANSAPQAGNQTGSREKVRINPVATQVYGGNGGDGLGFTAANEKTAPAKKEKKKWIVKERT